MLWKIFSSTPGLFPLKANNLVGDRDILKISKLIKLLVKTKNVSFILWKKKPIQTFWPTQYISTSDVIFSYFPLTWRTCDPPSWLFLTACTWMRRIVLSNFYLPYVGHSKFSFNLAFLLLNVFWGKYLELLDQYSNNYIYLYKYIYLIIIYIYIYLKHS